MKDQRLRRARWLILTGVAGITMAASPVMADVYKTVDADGNVTYTDQPPGPGAEPMKLRELSVVERPEYKATKTEAEKAAVAEQAESGEENPREVLRRMQAEYRDFRLVSPTPEQSYWGTANTATVAWDTSMGLQQGMKVRIYIDEQVVTTTSQSLYSTPRLDRGEHTVRAELLDAMDQIVALAGPVTFFIHQQNVNNVVRPTPRGG
ncbi:DUF4124 domain-containing protein [Marinihelvus fidelis]|nr:DUF4124 domain-containing protein [Marinihelvus fidelis]